MIPLRSRRQYTHLSTLRSEKPIKSRNKQTSDIFYDPEGVLAAPGVECNVPAKFADVDVHMDDWESNKEQIPPTPPVATKEDVRRVYLNPRRPSSKKAGARALAELSVDALYPDASSLATIFSAGKPGAPNKTMKGPTAGKPPKLKPFTPAIATTSTTSGDGFFRAPAVPAKYLNKAGIDLKTKEKILTKFQTPAPSGESMSGSGADGKEAKRDKDGDEECKENQPPRVFLGGVDPNNDRGFGADSPFGSDLPHLITPYTPEPILASDPSSKLRAPISVKEAMLISRGKELGSVPLVREGVLGELSADHLYLTEPRGLVYIPSAGLYYRHDSSQHFVPTMTTASGLRDIKKTLSSSYAFEIWEDGDDGSDDERKDKAIAAGVHGTGVQESEEEKECIDDEGKGEGDEDDQLEEDEYEALLKLHFGDGWSENSAKNPSSGTILVRYQASENASISYCHAKETDNVVEDETGRFPPPSKLRILHQNPDTDREVSRNPISVLAVKTAGNVEVVVRGSASTPDDNDENALPALVISCGDENEIPPDFSSILPHENHMPAVSLMNRTLGNLPRKASPQSSEGLPVASPRSWTVASPQLQPLMLVTDYSPPKPCLLSATATTSVEMTDNPLTPSFPASLQRLNSFREFRDPNASVPFQLLQHENRRHPTIPNDTDDGDRFGSLQSSSPCGRNESHILVKPEGTGGHENEEMLSQLNLICLQASNPTFHAADTDSLAAKSKDVILVAKQSRTAIDSPSCRSPPGRNTL